jgi:formate hydrogenlyase subunit 3/multisubunit Na+/H+ antiporter MnhD subunit
MGRQMNFIGGKISVVFLVIIFLAGLYSDLFPGNIPGNLYEYLPVIFSFIGLLLILKSFAERANAKTPWVFIISGQLFITLSIALFHENFGQNHILIYLSGAVAASIVGFICLHKIETIENDISLNRFHGHVYEHPVIAFIFLLACLGLIGFPFTPTFIGIDLLFSHIHRQEVVLIILTALSFIFTELSVMRIYARIFLGQHKKLYHPIAFRSS